MNGKRCGYGSCSCYGVHFISRYRMANDYCIDGKRVTVTDGEQVVRHANDLDVKRLENFLLDRYAKYLVWHCENKARYDFDCPIATYDIFPLTPDPDAAFWD
jgi:hypothetical protein